MDITMFYQNDNLAEFYIKKSNNDLNIEFIKFCESIKDDNFFLKVCEYYDQIFSGGLKELNDNPTEEGIQNFKRCIQIKAIEEIQKFTDYYERAKTSDC